ncbi:HAMP domain-containing sensor histidine kinase [Hathewaya limosa]|uniref:histidine kinase n=1 Tax=Hathewaya limosa TaxID=1536 RepID=A0ABU0JQB8_HATLI|nr:HAMP domain-containing sensor histidine kinase [Hathewaya limosa]MDQ0479287.1 signal transduction histidine kinase [Hathewaya limosa]
MKSIRKKLTKSYVKVILFSIVVLEIILFSFIRFYFYNNLEENLLSQIKTSAEFYNRYFSSSTLEENIISNVDIFWKQTPAQVQIIDTKGKILMDSIGVRNYEKLDTTDYKKALHNQYGVWTGKVSYYDKGVMALSYPLKSENNVIGVLRFVTSLEEVNKNILGIMILFLIIGAIVIFVGSLVSLVVANSIVEPIKGLTVVAEKMANGDFKARSEVNCEDEIGKLSHTLNYMAEEIEKKDNLKNNFISSVSHELRTPLTAIKGWAVVLNSDGMDKDTLGEGLNIIEKESDRLSNMVEELLDFSRFVSNKVTIKKEEFSVEALAKYLETYLKPRANREKINFKVICEHNLPTIMVDKNRLKQVCINIIDNAFKFTPENGEVAFKAYKKNNELVIEVQDTGCGISEEELPKVKEKFYKGKSSKSQNGIGLSICDEIIKLHNGEFIIESELGKGTKVLVKLKLS